MAAYDDLGFLDKQYLEKSGYQNIEALLRNVPSGSSNPQIKQIGEKLNSIAFDRTKMNALNTTLADPNLRNTIADMAKKDPAKLNACMDKITQNPADCARIIAEANKPPAPAAAQPAASPPAAPRPAASAPPAPPKPAQPAPVATAAPQPPSQPKAETPAPAPAGQSAGSSAPPPAPAKPETPQAAANDQVDFMGSGVMFKKEQADKLTALMKDLGDKYPNEAQSLMGAMGDEAKRKSFLTKIKQEMDKDPKLLDKVKSTMEKHPQMVGSMLDKLAEDPDKAFKQFRQFDQMERGLTGVFNFLSDMGMPGLAQGLKNMFGKILEHFGPMMGGIMDKLDGSLGDTQKPGVRSVVNNDGGNQFQQLASSLRPGQEIVIRDNNTPAPPQQRQQVAMVPGQ